MHNPPPPLNALRAFEAAARYLSMTKAALELNVTPGALSHQIRGLEDHLGLKLFDRGVRSIALTPAGKALHPGLQAGFLHIWDALASLNRLGDTRVLVISAPPGFTSKWLAPRLYRFSMAFPEIDVRVSSSINNANFTTDGVDVAIRNRPTDAAHDEALEVEKLVDQSLVPVCSPAFLEKHGPFTSPDMLKGVPLIHDDSLSGRATMPTWADWFAAAGDALLPWPSGALSRRRSPRARWQSRCTPTSLRYFDTVRRWVNHFGPMIAAHLRKRRPKPHATWHLDEVYLKIDGRMLYLWRAVDAEGEVLDVLVQSKRNKHAALKLIRKF